jgi:hypothetical protein
MSHGSALLISGKLSCPLFGMSRDRMFIRTSVILFYGFPHPVVTIADTSQNLFTSELIIHDYPI